MNALQRDLKKLVPLVESLGAEKAAADPHRQRFHIQPMVGWLNDGAAVLSIRYYPAGALTLRTVTSAPAGISSVSALASNGKRPA